MPSMTEKAEVLEDKIRERMTNLQLQIDCETDSERRRALEGERVTYLLDLSALLSYDVADDSPWPEEARQYPAFVEFGSRVSARGSIVDDYRLRVERSKSPDTCRAKAQYFRCTGCGCDDVVVVHAEAARVCTQCAMCMPYMSENGNLSFNDEKTVTIEGNFAYQKINHFKELLAQVQAKQHTEIPEEVLNKVKAELKKQRITQTAQVDMARINKILKGLKIFKYYEHCNYICYLITGRPPKQITPALENKLCQMFMEVEKAWDIYKPPSRHNFLSFPYVMYQMFKLLEADEFLPCFNLLKSPEKMYKTNMLWKKICAHLGWQFITAECGK